jgi:cytochrome c556
MQDPISAARPRAGGLAFAAGAVMLVAALAAPQAQRGGGQPAPPAKPMIPVAASTVAANPDAYVGETVSLTGAVEQALSKSAFSVDQDKTKSTGKDVLIVAPTLNGTVEPNTYVTVIGELEKFDPDEVVKKTKNYAIDLSPEMIARYRGKPVVIATAVINSAAIDIAKKPIPAMTAEEIALSKIMKQVGPASAAMRNVDGSNPDVAKQNIATLKQAFLETETFWKTKNKPDAIGWAQEARKHVDTMEKAAVAAKWDEVKAAAGTLGQACQSCHGAYRERMEDGTYRIKTGG